MPDKPSVTIAGVADRRVGRTPTKSKEGVVFTCGTGGLPLIKGADEFSQIKPGERLHGNDWLQCAWIHSTLRPECSVRLLAVVFPSRTICC